MNKKEVKNFIKEINQSPAFEGELRDKLSNITNIMAEVNHSKNYNGEKAIATTPIFEQLFQGTEYSQEHPDEFIKSWKNGNLIPTLGVNLDSKDPKYKLAVHDMLNQFVTADKYSKMFSKLSDPDDIDSAIKYSMSKDEIQDLAATTLNLFAKPNSKITKEDIWDIARQQFNANNSIAAHVDPDWRPSSSNDSDQYATVEDYTKARIEFYTGTIAPTQKDQHTVEGIKWEHPKFEDQVSPETMKRVEAWKKSNKPTNLSITSREYVALLNNDKIYSAKDTDETLSAVGILTDNPKDASYVEDALKQVRDDDKIKTMTIFAQKDPAFIETMDVVHHYTNYNNTEETDYYTLNLMKGSHSVTSWKDMTIYTLENEINDTKNPVEGMGYQYCPEPEFNDGIHIDTYEQHAHPTRLLEKIAIKSEILPFKDTQIDKARAAAPIQTAEVIAKEKDITNEYHLADEKETESVPNYKNLPNTKASSSPTDEPIEE